MKPRTLMTMAVAVFAALALYGCDRGGSLGVSLPSDSPVDTEESAALTCRAVEILPAGAHMALLMRNVADYEADVPQTILEKESAFWQALINAPLTPAAGDLYTPTTSTFAGIITEVMETMARQKLGTGFNSANCVGVSVISDDNELLSWVPADGTFLEHLQDKLLNPGGATAHIQFAWDDMPTSLDDTLAFFEEEFLTLLPAADDVSYAFREITAERVLEDSDYADLAGLTSGDHHRCWALMREDADARMASESLPEGVDLLEAPRGEDDVDEDGDTSDMALQLLCQHHIDSAGAGNFWFGVMLVTDSSIFTLEQMVANAREYMESPTKLTYNESSMRWGSELYTNLFKAMESAEEFSPDIAILADVLRLRNETSAQLLQIQSKYSLFKGGMSQMSYGFGVSFDEQTKAAIVAQFQATPDGAAEGYKDMMMSGNVDVDNLASGLDIGGMKIPIGAREISFNSAADIMVILGDKLAGWAAP